MHAVEFTGQNIVIAKDQPEYLPLPAFVGEAPEGTAVVTCWEFTEEEFQMVKETGRVWLMQLTFGAPMQPVQMSVEPLVKIIPPGGGN